MKTAIVICFDKGYIEPAAVFLDSFSENYHYKDGIDIVCIMPESDADSFSRLVELSNIKTELNLTLRTASDEKYGWLIGLKVGERTIAPSTWYRMFLGSLLPEYDKAIYFDPDILIVDNVHPIIDHPMRNIVMATYDTIGVPYIYNIHRGHVAHFVTGVLILDLKRFRESGVEDKFKEDMLTNGVHELLDEYYMNEYLAEHWYPLPVTFNFSAFTFDKYGVPHYDTSYLPDAYYKHAIAIHFAGPVKPWNYEIAGKDESLIGSEWRRRHALLFTDREPKGLGQ